VRNLLRRHDYLGLQHHIRCLIHLFPLGKIACQYPSLTCGEHYVGGGVSKLFSLVQLQPYLLKNHIMFTPSADVMYKFEGHHIETKNLRKTWLTQILCFVMYL
jgi:hypothetical protein